MGDYKPKTLALVRIEGTSIYLVLSTHDWHPISERVQHEYYIEERTCPKDLFLNTVDVLCVEAGDMEHDPHGIMELVDVVEAPADWPFTGSITTDRYTAIFPSLRKIIDDSTPSTDGD